MSKRILITRAREDQAELRRQLEARGFEPVLLPLITRRHVSLNFPNTVPDMLLASSRAALHSLRSRNDFLPLPLYIVGEASAVLAQRLGFPTVYHAPTVHELLQKLIDTQLPGRVLYARARDVSVNVKPTLAAAGYNVNEIITYETVLMPPHKVPENLYAATFFSVSAAKAWRIGAVNASSVVAVALSQEIAAVLQGMRWKHILTAPEPTLASLVDTLAKHAASD